MRLKCKVGVVTGAADGIGRGASLKLAREGVDLLLVDLNATGLSETAAMVHEVGRRTHELVIDVAAPDAPQRIIHTAVEEFGTFDIIFNNAGVSQGGPFLEISEETVDRVVAVNLRAPFLIGQAAARYWVAHNIAGRMVNTSSINAETIQSDSSIYCATKGGVRMLTIAAACDLGPHGITVNAVGPGHTRTGMTRHIVVNPELEQAWAAKTPLRRMGEPEDIANAVAYLVSEDASYVTGQTIYVEGGRTIHVP